MTETDSQGPGQECQPETFCYQIPIRDSWYSLVGTFWVTTSNEHPYYAFPIVLIKWTQNFDPKAINVNPKLLPAPVPTNHVRAIFELLRSLTIGKLGKRVMTQFRKRIMTQVRKAVLTHVRKQVMTQVGKRVMTYAGQQIHSAWW